MVVCLFLYALCCCESWELWALGSAVAFHEAGHILALRLCGVSLGGLSLGSTGLRLECEALRDSAEDAWVSLAGPAAGLLWALLVSRLPLPHALYASRLSLLLSLFNLLPLPLLDGGRIYRALGGSEDSQLILLMIILLPLLGLCLSHRLWYSAGVCLALLINAYGSSR